MDAADESTERLCAVFGSHLTEAIRCLVQVMIDPPRCQDQARDRRIAEARSIPELVAAVQVPGEDPRDLAEERGQLQARLAAERIAAECSAFNTKAELKKKDGWLISMAAENAELQKRIQASEDQRITSDNQVAAQQGDVEAHDEILARTTARLKQADEWLESQAKKINRDWQFYKKSLALFADRVARHHRYLAANGTEAADRTQRHLIESMKFTTSKTLEANRYLRKFVDDRRQDADTLMLLAEGGCIGELDVGLLGLDQDAVDIVRDAIQDLDPSKSAKAQATELAQLVHRIRDG
ncbi:hypothetical protein PR002_g29651, partial [Phytophthora rubi]